MEWNLLKKLIKSSNEVSLNNKNNRFKINWNNIIRIAVDQYSLGAIVDRDYSKASNNKLFK